MPLREFTSGHFMGRSSEIDVLANIAVQAGSGGAGSIILLGKRGTGKTELLRHLYSGLFNSGNNAVPFFYTVKTAFASVENFSKDYLANFILQYLAFIKKDASLINGIYSLDDLRNISNKPEAAWVSEIIDNYSQARAEGDLLKLFSYVISVPCQSYRMTGTPVVVIIDDFHKIRKLSDRSAGDCGKDLWMLFENSVTFRYSPHILAGSQAELQRMFFEETSLGEHLEIINLGGLGRHDSLELFKSLCEKYALKCEADASGFLDLSGGNPFYIQSFIQAARQTGRTLSPDVFGEIYAREITKGKIYTYWTSILKSYIQRFELRKPSLQLLFNMCENGVDDLSALSETLSVRRVDLDDILSLLHTAGIIETGFTSLELADDRILIDLIKGLYHREIIKEPWDNIKDAISRDKGEHVAPAGTPAFDIIIPAAPRAELVAVRALEQAAKYYKMPSAAIGQLQVSLIGLFSGLLAQNGSSGESYKLKFILRENVFSVEVQTSQSYPALADNDMRYIRPYINDVKVEEVINGSKITLVKELNGDFATGPGK